MSKLKLTKGELKNQRDSLKQYRRYLPTLQLKKQQLQIKILQARALFSQRNATLTELKDEIKQWSGLLAHIVDPLETRSSNLVEGHPESRVQRLPRSDMIGVNDLKAMVTPEKIDLDMVNVAGANVPVFKTCVFREINIDLYRTPFWIDKGIEQLRKMENLIAEVETIKVHIRVLEKELRITTQRVNLFEKVKIPECQENIRKIGIYLGDQQANAVGVSKVAKKKVEQKAEEIQVF